MIRLKQTLMACAAALVAAPLAVGTALAQDEAQGDVAADLNAEQLDSFRADADMDSQDFEGEGDIDYPSAPGQSETPQPALDESVDPYAGPEEMEGEGDVDYPPEPAEPETPQQSPDEPVDPYAEPEEMEGEGDLDYPPEPDSGESFEDSIRSDPNDEQADAVDNPADRDPFDPQH